MSGDSTPDERYFHWLYALIADPDSRDPSETHYLLCERLYKMPFVWSIRNDENRAADGLELRNEYLDDTNDRVPSDWFDLECSIFEMMISIARRASFQAGGVPDVWFWTMLDNIELVKYNDERYHSAIDDSITEALHRVMNRNYEKSGRGGFFPLRRPGRDQRRVELWYQMSAYLLENVEF